MAISISSKKVKVFNYQGKSFLISRENSEGTFEMPNGMTLNWYKQNSVAKAVYFLLLSSKGVCQKPYLQFDKLPKIDCILFIGSQSLTNLEFKVL